MKETCSCGAEFAYGGKLRGKRFVDVLAALSLWRKEHHCVKVVEGPEDDHHVASGPGGSDNQIAYEERDYSHPRIGFSPNGW